MGSLPDSVPIFAAPPTSASIKTWTLDTPPEIRLRGDEDDQSRFFHRVAAARQFEDGSFVIADGGSLELRFFSADGVLERTTGRSGEGPGDFGSFDLLSMISDSLFVIDRWNNRIAVLDRQGSLIRYVHVPRRARVKGVFDNGAILLGLVEPTPDRVGYKAIHEEYRIQLPDGSHNPVGRFLMVETHWIPMGTDAIIDVGLPFGRIGSVAVDGDDWFYADGSSYSVVQSDTNGAAVALFSHPVRPPLITDRDLEAWIAKRRHEGEPWSLEREVRKIPLHETMPAYDRLLVDHSGDLWAKTHTPSEGKTCWHVFQRRPVRFARVCFPQRFRPLDIGSNTVLGVERDEYDVEYVVRYRLVK